MSGNSVAAGKASTFRGDALAAQDRLPPEIRRALHEGVVSWNPHEALWVLTDRIAAGKSRKEAIAGVVAAIRNADIRRVAAFGPDSPHIRAGATILRYDEADHVRAGRRQP